MNDLTIDLFLNGFRLPLAEEFYSIQGEGFHAGRSAYFIRIGGCDIGCAWCDSKQSWDPAIHTLTEVADIVKNARNCPAKAMVVTGGEPLNYNLDPLCEELKKYGIKTFLETSGTAQLSGIWDWICLSPKKQSPPLKKIYTKAHELKVIIYDENDFAWAVECATKVTKNCKLFLQPEWSMYRKIISSVVEFVKQNPEWNISLQAHKFMKIP